jgi:hypothetical protein
MLGKSVIRRVFQNRKTLYIAELPLDGRGVVVTFLLALIIRGQLLIFFRQHVNVRPLIFKRNTFALETICQV